MDSIFEFFAGVVPVGTYINEIPVTDYFITMSTFDLGGFDFERIEFLKGPQGTMYGAASLGGTMRYILNMPNLDRNQGALHLTTQAVTDGGVNWLAGLYYADASQATTQTYRGPGAEDLINAVAPPLGSLLLPDDVAVDFDRWDEATELSVYADFGLRIGAAFAKGLNLTLAVRNLTDTRAWMTQTPAVPYTFLPGFYPVNGWMTQPRAVSMTIQKNF
jgi:outer membrane receptor protein involved in Fe transport